MATWSERFAIMAVVFGLIGSYVAGVAGAVVGIIIGLIIATLIWLHDREVEKEFAMKWTRLYCPSCQEVNASVSKKMIGKTVDVACRECQTRYSVEITPKHFRQGS